MKQVILLIVLITICSVIYAQTEEWLWAKQAGGFGQKCVNAITADNNGNSYVTGYFLGNATFGTTTLGSNDSSYPDIFIAKMDSSGNYLWAKRAGGTIYDYGYAISTDSCGNLYVTGYFTGLATFGSTTLISAGQAGNPNIFIVKMDTNGNYLWAKRAGGTSASIGCGISADNNGNSYVTGYFMGTAIFGTTMLTSSGNTDIYIAKIDSSGNFLWVKQAGGTSGARGTAISIDRNGNCNVTGDFIGNATFGTTLLVGNGSNMFEIFVVQLDTNGNWLWAKKAGGSGNDYGVAISTDNIGNSYVTGDFEGTATFGNTTLTSSAYSDIYIAKIDSSGNFLWAKRAGGTSGAISTDSRGNSYVTGCFNGTATFGTSILTTGGSTEIYIAKLDSNGNFLWAKQAGGADSVSVNGNGIATDSCGNIYVTGDFYGTVTFGNITLTSIGSIDIFIARFATIMPVLGIYENSITFINAYYGYYATHNLCLKNHGVETLSVDSLAFNLADTPFEVVGISLPIEVLEGDSTFIQVRFTPLVSGSVTDSLIVYNNSVNLPRAAIRLSGTGQYAPPLPPDNVSLVMQGNNAVISWDAVTETELHSPIVPDYYLVFFNGSGDIEDDYYYLGWTENLSYTHQRVGLHSASMFYRVRAYKDYSRDSSSMIFDEITVGMGESDVMRILSKHQNLE